MIDVRAHSTMMNIGQWTFDKLWYYFAFCDESKLWNNI